MVTTDKMLQLCISEGVTGIYAAVPYLEEASSLLYLRRVCIKGSAPFVVHASILRGHLDRLCYGGRLLYS